MEELTSTQSNDDDQENEESCVVIVEKGEISRRPNSETDRLIWSWLLDSMTEDILQDMLDREIWEVVKENGGSRWKKQIEMVESLKEEEEEIENEEDRMVLFFRRNPSNNTYYEMQRDNVDIEAYYWWYVDSGATGHATKYLVNFSRFSRCTLGERVRFGNGECMPVEHIGHRSFILGDHHCILKELLHVPRIAKNFLSVSKFTRDNGVYFEFHSHVCLVKHRETLRVLAVGFMFEGLYRLQIRLF